MTLSYFLSSSLKIRVFSDLNCMPSSSSNKNNSKSYGVNDEFGGERLTTLLMTHIITILPTNVHHSLICWSGSSGHNAIKETYQNGTAGNSYLIESDAFQNDGADSSFQNDRENISMGADASPRISTSAMTSCLLLYKGVSEEEWDITPIKQIKHIKMYTNMSILPVGVMAGWDVIESVDFSAVPSYITSIGEDFMKDCTSLRHIDLSMNALSHITKIEPGFLTGCTSLLSLNLEAFSNVEEIPAHFLNNCSSLKEVDISPLSRLKCIPKGFLAGCSSLVGVKLGEITRIGMGFMKGCSSLRHMDLSMGTLDYMNGIPPGFLGGCTSLQSLNLDGLVARAIYPFFLQNCSSLKELDVTNLYRVECIPEGFLSGCTSLVKLDFSDERESNVTELGPRFLEGCENSLESINLRFMRGVEVIESPFLRNFKRLKSIDLTPLSNVREIHGGSFLSGCSSIETIDLTPLFKVTLLSDNMLSDCSNLKQVILPPTAFPHMSTTTFPMGFLSGCSTLQAVDLRCMMNIVELQSDFLANCSSIVELDLKPLSNVTTLEKGFLSGCSALTSLDMSPLSQVVALPERLLSKCKSLTTVKFGIMSNITTIPSFFLMGCRSLESLDFNSFPNVTSIQALFLMNCKSLKEVDLSPLVGVTSVPEFASCMGGNDVSHKVSVTLPPNAEIKH